MDSADSVVSVDGRLDAVLVYADDLQPVKEQSILRALKSDTALAGGVCRVKFRIAEVSRFHLGRKFRIVFTVSQPSQLKAQTGSVRTEAILVLSKEKRPLAGQSTAKGSMVAESAKKIENLRLRKLATWGNEAASLLCGLQLVEVADGGRRVFQCLSCGGWSAEERVCGNSSCFLNQFVENYFMILNSSSSTHQQQLCEEGLSAEGAPGRRRRVKRRRLLLSNY